MKIWIVTIGEPLPIEKNKRLHRSGILMTYLQRAGHEVVWWTSTFEHVSKVHIYKQDKIFGKVQLNIHSFLKHKANKLRFSILKLSHNVNIE